MTNVIIFQPRSAVEASENVENFIEFAKKLDMFKHIDWFSNNWPMTQFLDKSRIKTRQAFCFSSFDTSGSRSRWQPMAEPFLSVSKGIMAYDFANNKKENHSQKLAAHRALEKALVETALDSVPRVENTNPHVLNLAAGYLDESNPGSSYKSGCYLKKIADFLNKKQMVKASFQWRNRIKRKEDLRIKIGKEADEKKRQKLPSIAAISAMPQIYHLSVDPRDIVFTSISAVLFCAPERFNEVWRLPANCEHEDTRADGSRVYGIRWDTSKDADADVKKILKSMQGLCKEALQKLRDLTEEARNMASWYEKNPEKLYLPKAFEHLRNEEYINARDLARLVGQVDSSKACRWANENQLQPIKVKEKKGAPSNAYRFRDVERVVINKLPNDFPIYDERTGTKYSEALLLVPMNLFHNDRSQWLCMFETFSLDTFNNQLGAGYEHGKSSIFSRNNYTEDDGSPIKVTSHQFRQYLNYLAQRKNVSQLLIARWSGRKSVDQNRAYNNTTTEERRTMLSQSGVTAMDSLELVGLTVNDPVTLEAFGSLKEILELEFQTVHETRYGFCVHSYIMLPCFRQRACLECTEHFCTKGDEAKTKEVKKTLKIAKEALKRDEKAIAAGTIGADKWFKFNEKRVARLTELVAHLEDPNLPPGSRIQLVNGVYTPIEIAVEDRMALNDIDGQWLRNIAAKSVASSRYVPAIEN